MLAPEERPQELDADIAWLLSQSSVLSPFQIAVLASPALSGHNEGVVLGCGPEAYLGTASQRAQIYGNSRFVSCSHIDHTRFEARLGD
jgi:hypothetical protein